MLPHEATPHTILHFLRAIGEIRVANRRYMYLDRCRNCAKLEGHCVDHDRVRLDWQKQCPSLHSCSTIRGYKLTTLNIAEKEVAI